MGIKAGDDDKQSTVYFIFIETCAGSSKLNNKVYNYVRKVLYIYYEQIKRIIDSY